MARNRRASPFEDFLSGLFEILKVTPIWVGPLIAAFFFLGLRFVAPLFLADAGPISYRKMFSPLLSMAASFLAVITLILWLVAEVKKRLNQKMFDRHTTLSSIRALSWRDFERYVAEAYRRQGYEAVVTGTSGGDGGVDVELRGHGEFVLVQCKQWRVMLVGVPVVRELLGVVTSERATRGILISSGRFTPEAIAFAGKNKIELVDGPALERLIDAVRTEAIVVQNVVSTTESTSGSTLMPAPRCPKCDMPMVTRTAKQGSNAGSQFWGCPKFPQCRGTRQMV